MMAMPGVTNWIRFRHQGEAGEPTNEFRQQRMLPESGGVNHKFGLIGRRLLAGEAEVPLDLAAQVNVHSSALAPASARTRDSSAASS